MIQTTFAVLLLATALLASELEVETTAGIVRGYRRFSRAGRRFLAFTGVPYAEPPVGPLRFRAPAEVRPWTGVRDTWPPASQCLQYGTLLKTLEVSGSEDCLYLYIYTANVNGKAAVLVHFHAGGFQLGNGPRWTEPDFMMDEDVVVVDVNFRLGYLGFLSFEDEEMPGNQGLKDQAMALRWVQRNILRFGGDPDSVSLVGESSGGISVYHHTVSPLSRGLFHRGIAESGTSYTPFSVAPPGFSRNMSRQLAKNLGCPTDNTTAAVDCLRSMKGEDIVVRVKDLWGWQIDLKSIWPCLEPEGNGSFLTGPVSRWQHHPVPMIIGVTSAEALFRTDYFLQTDTDFNWLSRNFESLAPTSLMYEYTSSDPVEVTKKIFRFYFPGGQIKSESWVNLTHMYSDSWFTIGAIDGANFHTGDVYFYCFDYIGENDFEKGYNKTRYFGPAHIAEVDYLWQRPWGGPHRGEDLDLSNALVKMWTNFAKTGNPNPVNRQTWKKWSRGNHEFLHIGNEGLEKKEGFAMDRYKFWKSIDYRDIFK